MIGEIISLGILLCPLFVNVPLRDDPHPNTVFVHRKFLPSIECIPIWRWQLLPNYLPLPLPIELLKQMIEKFNHNKTGENRMQLTNRTLFGSGISFPL